MSTAPSPTPSSLVLYSRMIKVSHTIFSLPFALAAALLAARTVEVTAVQIALILGCVLCARSTAMGFNRIVDRDIDAANPRTATREIPSGQISLRDARLFTAASAVIFVLLSGLLGTTTLMLSPIALAVVCGYSLAKRYTALCHLVLGLALALAPTAVWIALTDTWGWVPFLLSLAVGTWVAGFDIIYACQDEDFDRDNDLHSIPSALGTRNALIVSALLHLVTVAALCGLPTTVALKPLYGVGVALISAVLVYEHWIVRPGDLSRVNKAFFDLNGYISLIFLGFVAVS